LTQERTGMLALHRAYGPIRYSSLVLLQARALLNSSPEGVTGDLDADLRDTGRILQPAASTLDFSQPVAGPTWLWGGAGRKP
jgi:hypothetical protein